uniref:Uncharacterized protein n=1 Tax=Rhizophora mucronata TaxID=61149 RepID=A0A2P2PQR1_RHIMU
MENKRKRTHQNERKTNQSH